MIDQRITRAIELETEAQRLRTLAEDDKKGHIIQVLQEALRLTEELRNGPSIYGTGTHWSRKDQIRQGIEEVISELEM